MTARTGGFTLVEVMVATAIFAAAMTLISAAVTLAQRSWTRAESHSRLTADLRLTHRLFTDSLRRVRTALPAENGRIRGFEFVGTAQQIDMVVRRPVRSAVGGLYRLQYRIESNGTDNTLLLTSFPLGQGAPADAETAAARTVTLLSVPGRLSFSYFGRPERPGDTTRWLASWAGGPSVPALVRLRIDRVRDQAQPVPIEIVAEPAQTLAENCLDQAGGRDRARLRSPCL